MLLCKAVLYITVLVFKIFRSIPKYGLSLYYLVHEGTPLQSSRTNPAPPNPACGIVILHHPVQPDYYNDYNQLMY